MPLRTRTLDANEAVADVAYRLSEVIAIYPITPASPMGEHSDAWSADGRPNAWGVVPVVTEMQSEGGAAGAVHGALQGGALTTTFTSSQGLLLMLPNLFKIAGELSAFCMHVAARTVATHALSIFGDHSDVMAVRSSGMALVCSGSAQEAQDLAAIGHAVTLEARVPVLHFFDGFRTSHEIGNVVPLSDDDLRALCDPQAIADHRARALDPEHPVLRGTSQNPDVYFQSRQAIEPYYAAFPDIVAKVMQRFAARTGRAYRPFDYVGHPEASRVLVTMGSSAECAHETVERLVARGERVGLLKIRVFRPFSVERMSEVLPRSVRVVTVLDRTKEPGSSAEPAFQEVLSALTSARDLGLRDDVPRVLGGVYGLASKELRPAMVEAVFANMAHANPRRRFTLGIHDDVSGTSLEYGEDEREADDVSTAVIFGLGSDGSVSAAKSIVKIVGEKSDLHAQGYFEYDSRKAGSTTTSHLRFSPRPIRSTYRVRRARLVAVHDPELVERRDVLDAAGPGAILLVNTSRAPDEVFASWPIELQKRAIGLGIRLFVIDGYAIAERAGLGRRINTVMQVCFFALSGVMPIARAEAYVAEHVAEAWGKRGPDVVRRNLAALESALSGLHEVKLPSAVSGTRTRRPTVPDDAPDLVRRVTRLLLEGRGDELPVGAFPPDGTWPTGTSRFEKRRLALEIPVWQPDLCVECNFCSMVCPHAAVRTKLFDPAALDRAGPPASFRSVPSTLADTKGLGYVVAVAPEDCTGCGLCIEVCPAKDKLAPRRKALVSEPLEPRLESDRAVFEAFERLPSADLVALPLDKRTAALRLPLFEFSGACTGCGETPYVRLLTQLFGDRLTIANATGCSSIYGGNLPTTPYSKDAAGRGPAWINSLFEDNAELGYGLRLAADVRTKEARRALAAFSPRLPEALVRALEETGTGEAFVRTRRERLAELTKLLEGEDTEEAHALARLLPALVPRSLWIVGGDGWAYDIGFGGLDHVLASHADVNVLVLDTEVYSNTGGQQSKSTPLGASAKFATAGKSGNKKDLGLFAMSYGHVYVAEVAMQARSAQTVQAFLEAERHPGPSLVIAHSPCIAHGYDLVDSPAQQKRAIDSGMWPLYRFDPSRVARGEAPLVLDSGPPKLDVEAYMERESRFRMVQRRSPERYAMLVEASRHAVKERRALYEQLARIRLPEGHDHG